MPSQEEIAKYAKKRGISVERAARMIYGPIWKAKRERGEAAGEHIAEGISRSIRKMGEVGREYELVEDSQEYERY